MDVVARDGRASVVAPAPPAPRTAPHAGEASREGGTPTAPPSVPAEAAAPRRDLLAWARERLARALQARDVGPEVLSLFAVALAGTAAFVFLGEHFGMAACLGLVAFLLAEVSLVPRPWMRERTSFARALAPATEILLLGGLLGGIAVRHPPLVTALALLVLAGTVGLPRLLEWTGAAEPGVPWTRGDRTALLLVGTLLGRPGPALVIVALALGVDAWLRWPRDARGEPAQPRPGDLRTRLLPGGDLVPAVRWTTLAVAVVALLLLPVGASWRF